MNWIKIAGICGIFSAAIFFLFMLLSIYYSPWFSWTENYLSHLAGEYGFRPIWSAYGMSSFFFNIGLIIAGSTGIIFSYAIKKSYIFNTSIGKKGISILLLDMFALLCVGIFPVTIGKIHSWSSILLFILIPIFMFTISYDIQKILTKKWFIITSILFVISLGSIVIFLFLPQLSGGKAIAEMIVLSSIFTFIIILSYKLIRLSMKKREDIVILPYWKNDVITEKVYYLKRRQK